MKRLTWVGVSLSLLLAIAPARSAQQVTEIVELRYRTVDEVAALLSPLVPPPGVVTGLSGQLIIRTTPANLRSVLEVLSTIDKAPRQLVISVRHATSGGRESLAGGARIRNSAVQLSASSRGSSRSGQDVQQVRVLEGREAFIYSAQSVQVPESTVVIDRRRGTVTRIDTTRQNTARSGFYVRPRLSGDSVILDISPQRQRLTRGGGIRAQSASTTVRARLGEWIPIGGVDQSSTRSQSTFSSRRSRTASRSASVYLLVEMVR
ncbi:MAG: hypothetical protein HOI95_15050 [Chromatiales bacterium]|nr:hypothetical protein [Chromatiales bacterium]